MKERMKKFFNDKGFTLVELMVVVAILAVLSVIAIPLFSNSTAKAERQTCISNMRTIQSAYMMAVANGEISSDADVPAVVAAIEKNLAGGMPKCPSCDGKYTKDQISLVVTDDATKGIHVVCPDPSHQDDHVLKNQADAATA